MTTQNERILINQGTEHARRLNRLETKVEALGQRLQLVLDAKDAWRDRALQAEGGERSIPHRADKQGEQPNA